MVQFKALDQQVEWEWFLERNEIIQCGDSQGIVAYDEQGIQAMCVADSFSMDGCKLHFVVVDGADIYPWFTQEVARHIYVTCDRKRAFGYLSQNNKKALAAAEFMGVTEVARIPDAIREGVDQIVLCLTREDCRWLENTKEEAA